MIFIKFELILFKDLLSVGFGILQLFINTRATCVQKISVIRPEMRALRRTKFARAKILTISIKFYALYRKELWFVCHEILHASSSY